jgi:LPXTG-site transpeptidase (sortase) family protein
MLLCWWLILWGHTFAVSLSQYTLDTIIQLRAKWVKVYTNDKLDIQQPDRIYQTTTGIQFLPTWATYWIDRLPYKQDKNADQYLVLPRLGIVTPIADIPSTDSAYNDLFAGLSVDFNTYLQNGVVHYPSAKPWNTGNVVLAGHSSYWKSDTGRYKNIFFTLPLLEFGDQIWIYIKNKQWWYDRLRYTVQKSFETLPTNIDVIKQTTTKTLTLFTCVPIGTIQKRRIVQAQELVSAKKIARKKKLQ